VNNCILLDFDGTITTKDTTRALLNELVKLRPWRVFGVVWFGFKMVSSNNSVTQQAYKNRAIGHLIAGLTDSHMSRALSGFSKKVTALYRPGMLKKIKEADENGTSVLIVTASPSFAISYCFSDLPVIVVGTEFKKNGDVYCGQLDGQNCYGSEKVNRIEYWVRDRSMDIYFTEAWSDHFSDYPMLKMAEKRYWIGGELLREIVRERDPSGNFVLNEG
jgi:phosphatidylglycerophosphatase C